jgi:thiamine biosynthesis lipoprotein
MGTLVTITLYAESDEQARRGFVAAFSRVRALDAILSDYNPDSELSRVCEIPGTASLELTAVITRAQRLARETGGAFDITTGALTALWRNARKQRRLPSPEAIAVARSLSGYQELQIEDRRIRCLKPGMRLDAGGIAKGFAADEALAALRSSGITSALVVLSGDIAAGAPPPGLPGWRVQVQEHVFTLANAAVSTSGDEFQHVTLDGVRYSHILDPRTGMALPNTRPVSVIARTAIESDSRATAFAVLGRSGVIDLRD